MLLARLSGGKLARKCLLMGAREAKQWQDFTKTGRSGAAWGGVRQEKLELGRG